MKRNALRVVCNPGANRISYYFRNEIGEWMVLSDSSPLSRQFYTKTTMKERYKEIAEKIDEIYNRKNKGLDIFFEGTSENFDYLNRAITYYLPDRNIVCKQRTTKIAVVGKTAVGKSFLIKGIEEFQGHNYKKIEKTAYTEYLDEKNNICWYEIMGIDLGKGKVEEIFSIIRDLVSDDLSTVIYCISGITGRIEEIEKEFITKINHIFAGINVLTAITMCYKDDVRMVSDEIEKITDHMMVFPTLAREYRVKNRVQGGTQSFLVEPFGLEALYTYIFEGKKVPRQYQAKMVVQNEVQHNENLSRQEKEADVKELSASVAASSAKERGAQKAESRTDSKTQLQAKTEQGNRKSDVRKKKVAVVGKIAVGKSTLIEGLERWKGVKFRKTSIEDAYCLYEDERNNVQWYEVKGIDLGRDRMEETYSIVKALISQGVSRVAYCISAESGRTEEIEKDLIKRLVNDFPSVKVTIVLTRCFKEEIQEVIDDVSGISNQVRIVQTLAKEYKTGVKNPKTGMSFVIEPFGLDEVYQCITYEFWGGSY